MSLLTKITPKLKLNQIILGENYQFSSDRYTVRKVLEINKEIIKVKTLGESWHEGIVRCHYSWLRENNSQLEYLHR